MTDQTEYDRLVVERDRYAQVVADLTERFDEKVEELSLVRQVGDTMGSSLDQRTICVGTVDLVQLALAPENCSVMLVDQSGALVLAAARGAYDDEAASYEPAAEPVVFEPGEGIAGAVLATRQPILLDESSVDPRFRVMPDSEIQPRSLLCVPLLARGRAIGVLNLSDSVQGAFEPRHERILTIIANAVAMALENANLFFEVTRSREALATENKTLRRQLSERFSVDGLIGNSPAFRSVLQLVERVADTTANVLITGESGTGKEVIARTIHHNSGRKDEGFVAVNCAALPESLLEAELFGIEKGVATGVDARPGTFEKADGGTLFLDEIGDMPASVQVRLLRVLQERQVQRVGGSASIDVDVRVITATHRTLHAEIAAGRFREDLFYRLKVVAVELPALRERRQDILPLGLHFVGRFAAKHARPDRPFSKGAARTLLEYRWPGNVRELEHCIEQAVILSDGDEITSSDLGLGPTSPSGIRVEIPEEPGDFQEVVEIIQGMAERELIARALKECEGNRSRAARMLGLARRTLLYKLNRYQIS